MSKSSMFENMILTDEQMRSVQFNSGDLLIKGAPGSGKSVVIMKRALRFNREANENNKDVRIVIFAFATSLVKYTNEIMQGTVSGRNMITVSTIDSYCIRLVSKMTRNYNIRILEPNERITYVQMALHRYRQEYGKHRFLTVEPDYWADEFLWIKQKYIRSLSEYENANRKGRGGKVRITREERKIVYTMFELYRKILRERNKHDFEDLYTYLITNSNRIPKSAKFDYVLVDEAQDLTYTKLLTAKNLSLGYITVAADRAQKIYKTSFTWRELGIDVTGRRSKSLDKPFRCTKQIVELAESLIKVNRERDPDAAEFTEPVFPETQGGLPCIFECSNAAEEQDRVLEIARKMLELYDTVALLFRKKSDRKIYANRLSHEGIEYQIIDKEEKWSATEAGIKLSTVHSSKGLEFDAVIVPSFTKGNYPNAWELEGADNEQQEEIIAKERSLLYVGMTRAKNELYLTFIPPISDFIAEMREECYDYVTSSGVLVEKQALDAQKDRVEERNVEWEKQLRYIQALREKQQREQEKT